FALEKFATASRFFDGDFAAWIPARVDQRAVLGDLQLDADRTVRTEFAHQSRSVFDHGPQMLCALRLTRRTTTIRNFDWKVVHRFHRMAGCDLKDTHKVGADGVICFA